MDFTIMLYTIIYNTVSPSRMQYNILFTFVIKVRLVIKVNKCLNVYRFAFKNYRVAMV